MKKHTRIARLILIVLSMVVGNSYAQKPTENTENKIVMREANFVLKFVGEEVNDDLITLRAVYETKGNIYTLQFVKNNDTIKGKAYFTYPLNYEYFSKEINNFYYNKIGQINTNESITTKQIIAQSSIEPIFFWMYAMKGELEEKTPIAGKMHVRRYAMIFKDQSEIIGEGEREMVLDSIENKMYAISMQAYRLYNNVIRIGDSFKHNYRTRLEETVGDSKAEQSKIDIEIINQEQKIDDFVGEALSNNNLSTIKTNKIITELDNRFIINNIINETKLYHDIKAKQKEFSLNFNNSKIFLIKNITIKIERGFIEDVHVEIENDHNGTDWYDNIIPIGISSLNNIKSLGSMKLFIRKPKWSNQKDFVYLSDILGNYDIHEEMQTRDYAPADTVINNLDPTIDRFIVFKREQRIQLFDSRIYSDLAGLDDKSPNGLLQIEVARRFNFLTNRLQYGGNRADWGYLNYLYIYGTLSKIDQKLRRLPLNNAYIVENNTIVSPDYATNLSLRQYENASLGIDINGLTHNYKDGKFIIYADAGIRYGHIPILDTVKMLNDNGDLVKPTIEDDIYKQAHTVTVSPKAKFEYISERRLGFTVTYQYNYTWLFSNNNFKQITSLTKSDLSDTRRERTARQSHQFCFEVRVMTGNKENDNLFLRSRFFVQQGDANTFFPQIQIGYNYNLIFKK